MPPRRPYVLSIAGLDPSAGAGLLSDVKTFEQHQVYGFGVCSALTVQTDVAFYQVQWLDSSEIIKQVEPLISKFKLAACKIGIIKNWNVLIEVLEFLKNASPELPIVLDPVLKASAGFTFQVSPVDWEQVLPFINLLTPNYEEMQLLEDNRSPEDSAVRLSRICPILLKGGHHPDMPGTDALYQNGKSVAFPPMHATVYPKHGSGCVLSAAITANIALGYSLPEACQRAKQYTETFLSSSSTLIGYHTPHD